MKQISKTRRDLAYAGLGLVYLALGIVAWRAGEQAMQAFTVVVGFVGGYVAGVLGTKADDDHEKGA